jgi:hypothetical protein
LTWWSLEVQDEEATARQGANKVDLGRSIGLGGLVSGYSDLGRVGQPSPGDSGKRVVRLLLPVGLLLAAIGYYGPWIVHRTAALSLSGVDMGEFVKFLPGALDGSVGIVRQAFYLPPLAIVIGVALVAGSRQLRYTWLLRGSMLVLAVPVSLQLLPPAWSPASLAASEFRLQAIALAICWLSLAGFWILGQLSVRVTGLLGAVLALLAGMLSAWQFFVAQPAIDAVYRIAPPAGWGFFLCLAGLAIVAVANGSLVFLWPYRGVRASGGGEGPWASS